MDKRADLLLSIFVVALAVWLWVQAGNLAPIPVREPIGPRGLPQIIAVFMGAGGLLLVLRRLATWRKTPGWIIEPDGEADDPDYPVFHHQVFVTIALTIAYLAFAPVIGFWTTSLVYTAVLFPALGVRSWKLILSFTVGAILILYVIFAAFLNMRFPAGLEGPIVALFPKLGFFG